MDITEQMEAGVENTFANNPYAEWYLKEYLGCHINENMELEKRKLLQSVPYQVCQTLSASDSVNSGRFKKLYNDIQLLQLADSKVNKERIL